MGQTPTDSDPTAITPAVELPGYQLLGMIGCGGTGTVYRARQVALDRPVAVKAVRPDHADSPTLPARFEAEAAILGRLGHPNIIQIHDRVRHAGQLFLVLELLDGEDLGQRVQRVGRHDEGFVWAVARQAVAALAHAAGHGVVHRDIKPSNLFLVRDPDGGPPTIKVMDFGLAKSGEVPPAELLTAPGTVLGTPVYMPPEQARGGRNLDHRADIYALGATVFHALAGAPPFEGPTVWELMARKLSHTPRLGPPVSRASADLVAAMMAVNPDDRIGSYAELAARIDDLLAGLTATDARLHRSSLVVPEPSRLWPAAALGLVVVAGLMVWAASGARPSHLTAGEAAGQPAPTVEPAGDRLALYDGVSLSGWTSLSGVWQVERDDEGLRVLSGNGTARRAFDPAADCRLTLGLDVHKAATAEVQVWPAGGSGPWPAVRVSRDDGGRFGTRTAPARTFAECGRPVLFPTADWFENRRPYLEVRLERVGGVWTAWFNGREVGRTSAGGPDPVELRVVAEGGPVRIDTAEFTALRVR